MANEATTVVEWSYEPAEFFSQETELNLSGGRVVAFGGVARGEFQETAFDGGAVFQDAVHEELKRLFLGQQLATGLSLTLNKPRITRERKDGSRDVLLVAGSGHITFSGLKVEAHVIHRGLDGEIISDSQRDRAAYEEHLRQEVFRLLPGHPELQMMLGSFQKSFDDEANFYLYLYEITDRLATLLGGANAAKKVLGRGAWDSVTGPANVPSNALGRHRGRSNQHEVPDSAEMRRARAAALSLIRAYIDHVS